MKACQMSIKWVGKVDNYITNFCALVEPLRIPALNRLG